MQMLEASLYISQHLPDGASGLWAVVHCATWVALGELEWIPFAVLRKSIDINLLGAWAESFSLSTDRGKRRESSFDSLLLLAAPRHVLNFNQ